MSERTYSISEFSAEFDITTRSIRFYEEKGLLHPIRQGQNRIFSAADRVKLKLILRGKRLGFSLEESRQIIEMYDPAQGNIEQYQSLIRKIREKRSQLQQQLADIEAMMVDLNDSEERCLQAMVSEKKA
ncbi:MAG: MerR family DNA-binding transcriptional regulator [Gammaproteobacteria bacterium]|nr:MerR family DNA-binding transcriptional regulator [Gammaproteobacteria bacterium]NND39284.1 MerR family DNA-binding transcriptional regulator [Pseudomonadales bacterium]